MPKVRYITIITKRMKRSIKEEILIPCIAPRGNPFLKDYFDLVSKKAQTTYYRIKRSDYPIELLSYLQLRENVIIPAPLSW